MASENDKLFYELFIATLGMFSIDSGQNKVGPAHIEAQFNHVLEARDKCEQIFNVKGPKPS